MNLQEHVDRLKTLAGIEANTSSSVDEGIRDWFKKDSTSPDEMVVTVRDIQKAMSIHTPPGGVVVPTKELRRMAQSLRPDLNWEDPESQKVLNNYLASAEFKNKLAQVIANAVLNQRTINNLAARGFYDGSTTGTGQTAAEYLFGGKFT